VGRRAGAAQDALPLGLSHRRFANYSAPALPKYGRRSLASLVRRMMGSVCSSQAR
jgi:hypothetical protein